MAEDMQTLTCIFWPGAGGAQWSSHIAEFDQILSMLLECWKLPDNMTRSNRS
jgi:hypothetical protein